MSVDIFGRPTTSSINSTTEDNLKAEDKLMKIDIMNVKTNMQSNDDDIHDHLIRIKFLEQELENGLTKQKQDIITETEKFMENKTFDQLKVKSIAYFSDDGPTQITNWKSFKTKIDYIESGIRELEDYINFVKSEMQRKYNILDSETEKTLTQSLNTINNHLKNIKDKHDNFKEDVRIILKNDINNSLETLELYHNRIKDITTKVEDFVATLNLYDNKIRLLKDDAVKEAIRETIQIIYDSGMFGLYENADEVLKDYLTFNNRRRTIME